MRWIFCSILALSMACERDPTPQGLASAQPVVVASARGKPPSTEPKPSQADDPDLKHYRHFVEWVEAAIAAISKNPSDTPEGASHPVLGPIDCYTDRSDPEFGFCTSSKDFQNDEEKFYTTYWATWKQGEPDSWILSGNTPIPAYDCKSLGYPTTIRSYRYANALKRHCRDVMGRHLIVEKYPDTTKVLFFTEAFIGDDKNFAATLREGQPASW